MFILKIETKRLELVEGVHIKIITTNSSRANLTTSLRSRRCPHRNHRLSHNVPPKSSVLLFLLVRLGLRVWLGCFVLHDHRRRSLPDISRQERNLSRAEDGQDMRAACRSSRARCGGSVFHWMPNICECAVHILSCAHTNFVWDDAQILPEM